jgi:hypothetical protein
LKGLKIFIQMKKKILFGFILQTKIINIISNNYDLL